ncbi:MAG: penicillin-binding protein activator LpoB [Candidatus Omnitrophica bacterium]|nr:penicillin-binding protein activator LpoB [Candidatus Omnitrophota bacterium]
MVKNKFYFFAIGVCLVSFAGCSSTQVKRVEPEEVVDLSGRWNDTDSRLVAKEMIGDVLARSWVTDFRCKQNRKPVVIVGPLLNKSHEHINGAIFVKDLERQLLNSGKIKFVASKEERPDVRDERQDQRAGFTNPETIKKMAMETGADYILIGSINSVKDEFKGRYVILYQVNLELIDIETNEKAWIGQKHIKKVVKRSKYSL